MLFLLLVSSEDHIYYELRHLVSRGVPKVERESVRVFLLKPQLYFAWTLSYMPQPYKKFSTTALIPVVLNLVDI